MLRTTRHFPKAVQRPFVSTFSRPLVSQPVNSREPTSKQYSLFARDDPRARLDAAHVDCIIIQVCCARKLTTRNMAPDVRGTETIEPPVPVPNFPPFEPHKYPSYGEAVLLVVPTNNEFKKELLLETFRSRAPHGVQVHLLTLPICSEVGEQPYNKAGALGAYNRISNVLKALHSDEHQEILRRKEIGTIIVAAIENFIQIDQLARPTDFGVLVVHNATTGSTRAAVSRGVTVDPVYVERARQSGFDGHPDHGKTRVGRIIADHVPGVDEADWHIELAGYSRYEILRVALDGLELPWDIGREQHSV